MRAAGLTPLGDPDVIVKDLPAGGHSARNLALSADGRWLFVNVGSPSNSCQEKDRSLESPGKDPCPELETRAGVWRFDARRTNHSQGEGERYATRTRNAGRLCTDPAGQLGPTR